MSHKKQLRYDKAYLKMALEWGQLSHCKRRQVGALIVKDNMIISDGYNGTPKGFDNICEDEENYTKWYVLHAGCMVMNGKINRKSKARLIRDGIVIITTELASLKRFQDDVKEVSKGYDCGIQLKNYNDIKVGDIVESFNELKIKKKLKK